jgi:hypothetical protein
MSPPQILDYKGISVKIPENDHPPIHIHAYYSGSEYGVKAELIFTEGKLSNIKIKKIRGKKVFSPAQIRDLEKLINVYSQFILDSWMAIFIKKERIKSKHISKL